MHSEVQNWARLCRICFMYSVCFELKLRSLIAEASASPSHKRQPFDDSYLYDVRNTTHAEQCSYVSAANVSMPCVSSLNNVLVVHVHVAKMSGRSICKWIPEAFPILHCSWWSSCAAGGKTGSKLGVLPRLRSHSTESCLFRTKGIGGT